MLTKQFWPSDDLMTLEVMAAATRTYNKKL